MKLYRQTIISCLILIAVNTNPNLSSIMSEIRGGLWGLVSIVSTEFVKWSASFQAIDLLLIIGVAAISTRIYLASRKSV